MITLVLAASCKVAVSPEPLGDYTSWKRVDVTGEAPGHGDTYRIIYANDIAADPTAPLYVGYAEGSIIVKEIYANDAGEPGVLKSVVIMRRIGSVMTALENQGGWLFSESQISHGAETQSDTCWNRCHVASPYNGAWYDYTKL